MEESSTKPGDSSPNGGSTEITMKDFLDFMKTAYQVYESVEGNAEDAAVPAGMRIDWEELERSPVIRLLGEAGGGAEALAAARRGSEGGQLGAAQQELQEMDSFETNAGYRNKKGEPRRNSLSTFPRRTFTNKRDNNNQKYDSGENYVESVLKSKLSDVLNEGILDSVLPYMVAHAKPVKSVSGSHQPIIKKTAAFSREDAKKSASFGGFVTERESKDKLSVLSRDKLGRRKSSTGGDKAAAKGDGEVEIHVCDEVKGVKRDFRCPQKLLVSKMGYFADVTSGQKLEDMDISVHCDIQIFDWLMRWVKKDTILVADWPILDPTNVVPILVSASFLQMDPLLHDCLMYCHSHMSDIVKTNTNLACLNDTILTRLGAMYTNSELETIKDRKDKIQSRLFCKMVMSLAEPVPETLRGHYASLATLYKCSKCTKLLPRQIADKIPCQPPSMTIDRWGNVLSSHSRDLSWNLSEYISWLYGEMRSWRKVYWRLWGECHFLKCQLCDNYFPVYQMEWCCYHADAPQYFSLEPSRPTTLPLGRFPCCNERAYRFQVLTNNSGCQFRSHVPSQLSDRDAAVLALYEQFKDAISLEPLQLIFPERLTRLVARESGSSSGRLCGREVFWWEGLRLAPPRQPLGLLGKLYSGASNPKTNTTVVAAGGKPGMDPSSVKSSLVQGMSQGPIGQPAAAARAGTPPVTLPRADESAADNEDASGETSTHNKLKTVVVEPKALLSGGSSKESSSSDAGDMEESDSSSGSSSHSEESSPPRSPPGRRAAAAQRQRPRLLARRRTGGVGRKWAAALSARSNQDHQRQYEERATRQMRALLTRRAAQPNTRQTQPIGGIYVRLEAEWREASLQQSQPAVRPPRHQLMYSSKAVKSKQNK